MMATRRGTASSLYFGENLDVLREHVHSASYHVLFQSPKGDKSHAPIEAFVNTWHWGEQTGSLYLHCDPTASHYLKIVIDGVLGPEGFNSARR